MSKGSTQRPTDKSQFDRNYDRIFGNKENKQERQETDENPQQTRSTDRGQLPDLL